MKLLNQQVNWHRDSAYHLMLFLLMDPFRYPNIPRACPNSDLLFCGYGTALILPTSAISGKPIFGHRANGSHLFGLTLKNVWIAFIEKCRTFFSDKPALIIASLYLMLVIGLLWSADMHYALKDLRTKVPLIILPLFLATGPKVNTRTLNWMIIGFSLALLGGTIYRLILLYNLPVADSRNITAHMSHIRFSLNLVLGLYAMIYLAWKKFTGKTRINISLLLLAAWFLIFMIYMHYNTGVAITAIVGIVLAFVMAFRQSGLKSRTILIFAALLIIIVPVIYISSVIHEFNSVKPVYIFKLDQRTANGNPYTHDTIDFVVENGAYPGLYICDGELREGWNKISRVPFDKFDQKKQLLRSTLIRYMASKDLRKDSVGLQSLTEKDIKAIESGIANSKSISGFNIKTQIYNYVIAYRNYRELGDPNAGSLIQRLEYWRTSWLIIRQQPLFGVGTGDVPSAFEKQYGDMNSPLKPEFRKRSHNQYLSTLVAFGLIGFIWFMFALIYPAIRLKGFRHYYYLVFFTIAMISMVTEDTLESQEGVTFFAFFTCLFLLTWKHDTGSDFGKNKEVTQKQMPNYSHIPMRNQFR